MTLLQSLTRLVNLKAAQNETQAASASRGTKLLGWYASEEEKDRGDMEDAISQSLEKVQIKKRPENYSFTRNIPNQLFSALRVISYVASFPIPRHGPQCDLSAHC